MIMMQETRTLQYTSLKVQFSAREQSSSTEGDPDEGYRAELQAGLEKLIADNQRPLQDILDYAFLSDSQVESVEYFSMTLIQTTTVVVQQTSLPSVDALVEMLRDQFATLMDRLFPEHEDYFGPEVLPPDEKSDGEQAGEASPQRALDATSQTSQDTPPAAVAQAEDAVTSPNEESVDATGPESLFYWVQRFTLVFTGSVQSFQEHMQPFLVDRSEPQDQHSQEGIFSREFPGVRNLGLYKALNQQLENEGAASREA